MKNQTNLMPTIGVLDITENKTGYLRSLINQYHPHEHDPQLTPQIIKRYHLQTGDTIRGLQTQYSKQNPTPQIIKITNINHTLKKKVHNRKPFYELTPQFPIQKFNLSTGKHATLSTRFIDIITPIGKGQRSLIVAQPKTGKTTILKQLANVIIDNHPEVTPIVLLIDERPEEVTDMKESLPPQVEILSSTFDQPPQSHQHIAQWAYTKAMRLVECGKDVVILLDSITRLARASNQLASSKERTLSGGLATGALQFPKSFFGAARNTIGAGSLTIIATALIGTDSRMDNIIFEEFKATGNMELQLARRLSDNSIYPAIDVIESRTRREELLVSPHDLKQVRRLRTYLQDNIYYEAIRVILKRLQKCNTNELFFEQIDSLPIFKKKKK